MEFTNAKVAAPRSCAIRLAHPDVSVPLPLLDVSLSHRKPYPVVVVQQNIGSQRPSRSRLPKLTKKAPSYRRASDVRTRSCLSPLHTLALYRTQNAEKIAGPSAAFFSFKMDVGVNNLSDVQVITFVSAHSIPALYPLVFIATSFPCQRDLDDAAKSELGRHVLRVYPFPPSRPLLPASVSQIVFSFHPGELPGEAESLGAFQQT